jgi:AcrR family transcriptional regulator
VCPAGEWYVRVRHLYKTFVQDLAYDGLVGNREALLQGAKKCLLAKGYARTTARDIAAASGVSLAAIGYHFRTTEALLHEAIFQAIGQWGEELGRMLAEEAHNDGTTLERFEAVWTRVIESFRDHRGVLAASYEIMTRAEEVPEVRRNLAAAIESAKVGLARLLADVDPNAEPERARQVGSFYYAILSGLMTQWLVDPHSAPSGKDLAAALGELLAAAERDAHPPRRARST